MSRSHVVVSKADARKMKGPALEIAPGAVVTPIHDYVQASHDRQRVVGLRLGARYVVAALEGGFAQVFVTLAEQPGEKFPGHLFAKAA